MVAVKWTGAAMLLLLLLLWFLSRPEVLTSITRTDYRSDTENGARMFHAGGCAACHAGPDRSGEDVGLLGGGLALKTPFGLFRVPNISSHPEDGIGAWSPVQFVNAMQRGVSPRGRHYYPAFPYTSYARMSEGDILDLKAYLDTLPPVAGKAGPHELDFPWNLRRGIGLWKIMNLDAEWLIEIDESNAILERGRYLAEGPAHCGECHTSRNVLGGLKKDSWLAGAPDMEEEGRVSNITPHPDGLASWSEADITYYLESGLTPDYDSVGGSMVDVQENMARLPASDREAIAAYLKAVPARPTNSNSDE
jgi:mono/diheme cytochrome c family protein